MMADKVRVSCTGILVEDVDSSWDQAGPLLQKAIDKSDGEYSQDDILRLIMSGEMQLWGAFDIEEDVMLMAMVTEIIIYPQHKSAWIVLSGGTRLDDWFEGIHNLLLRWAKYHGCKNIRITGRTGWERKLKHLGYNKLTTVLSNEIGD